MSSRRQSILDAALACVTDHGIDGCTVEMIRDRSGASIGSLYHHFASKEGLLAALYLAGIQNYADQAARALAQATSAEQLLKTVVQSYLRWVWANPDWARFLLHSRGRVEAGGELKEALRDANQRNWQDFAQRLADMPGPARLKQMPDECLRVILLGPSHELARRWLAGRLEGSLAAYETYLCEAAWQSLKNLDELS
jgi:AcrR family transcriptional regulator